MFGAQHVPASVSHASQPVPAGGSPVPPAEASADDEEPDDDVAIALLQPSAASIAVKEHARQRVRQRRATDVILAA